LDRLWRPWRYAYVTGPRTDDCVFCAALAADRDEEHYLLYRGETCFVILNAYPYNTGHAMILPNRCIVDVTEMTAEESHETADLIPKLVRTYRDSMGCQGVNVGLNLGSAAGGSIAHLHWHLVPRWGGDTNFMPVVGDSKVVVEMLQDTYQRLKPFVEAWS
jgi:ATP adenylyltransferase